MRSGRNPRPPLEIKRPGYILRVWLRIVAKLIVYPQGAYNASVHYARGKTLGGCTARNYMAYQRGTVDSYAKWGEYSTPSIYKGPCISNEVYSDQCV